ncbi:MAG: N-6 DNA methylase [Bacteroidales bacterium]|nr:N-6 DNA methylase [Bacteroidales bacterium]
MQNNIVSNIIWAYAAGRRGYTNLLGVRFELLSFLYREKAGIGANAEVLECLEEQGPYVKGILSETQALFLLDNYKEAVESCLSIDVEGKQSAEHRMPVEIAEFIYGLLGKPADVDVYNPFSGMCSFPLAFKRCHSLCYEINRGTWASSIVRMHAYGIDANIQCCDALSAMSSNGFKMDNVVCCPPFGMRKEMTIANIVDTIFEHLSDNGVCAIVVEAGFLSRQVDNDSEVRNKLIRSRAISSVVLLPGGLFTGSNIQTAVVLFTKQQNESVFMYDASIEFIRDKRKKPRLDLDDIWEAMDEDTTQNVPYEEIDQDGCLLPRKYINPLDPNKYVRLGDIASVVAPTTKSVEFGSPYINASSLVQGVPIAPIKPIRNTVYWNSGSYYKITEPVIIFDFNIDSLKVRVGFTDTRDDAIYAAKTLNVIIPNEVVSKEYLMLTLQSDEVKYQLMGLQAGVIHGRIKKSDLLDVRIPIVPIEEQIRSVNEALSSQISESEKLRVAEFESFQKEIRIRKHALAGRLSVISSKWNRLESFIRDNGGSISIKDLIGKRNPITVEVVLNQISSYLKDALFQVDNLAGIEYDWGGPVKINVRDFLEKYAHKHQSSRFFISIIGIDDYSKKGKEICSVRFPEKALCRVMDDIISNATAHGFNDETRFDYRILFDWWVEDDNIVLSISNNGTPLKEDAREDMVLSYGYSTSLNTGGHLGIGGHEIKSIVEKFGGKVEFISTPEEEYTITYHLYLPDVSRLTE